MGRFINLALIIFNCNLIGKAQNLLLNGGFESTISKVGDQQLRVDSFYARDWFLPTDCTVDIYRNKSICTNEYIRSYEPILNFCINTYSGNYNIGLTLIDAYGSMEHISGILSKSLIKDKLYKVNFYLKYKANKYSWASKGFGYKFSTDSVVFKSNILELEFKGSGLAPYYYNLFSAYKVYSDFELDYLFYDTTWTKIETIFKAKGGERYLTFGKFAIPEDSKIIKQFNSLISRKRIDTDDKNIADLNSKVLMIVPLSVDDETPTLTNYYFMDAVEVIAMDSLEQIKYESCPFCVDLDPDTSFPSSREYNNLFNDRGWVGNISTEIIANLGPMEKLTIEYGKNKKVIIINAKNAEEEKREEVRYDLNCPVKKLRGKPFKWRVEKTNLIDIKEIEKRFGKGEIYNINNDFGKVFKN